MRIHPIFIALAIAAPTVRGQCSPGTQRLVSDRRTDEARALTQAAISKTPADHVMIECLGRILMEEDRPKDASVQFERAVKLDDKVSSHHLWLANSLGSLADSTSKIKLPFLARRIKGEFDKAVALDPASIEGRHGLIQFYSQAPGVMGGSMDKAREQVREIAKLNPVRGHFEAAELYAQDKNIAAVEREYVAAEKEYPDTAQAAYNLGSFYQNQQRWTDAFAVYDRMLTRFPDEATVHYQIGRAAALSGEQMERGEKELKWWIAHQPKDAALATRGGAHARLGMIHEKEGKKDLARADYQAALAIDPNSDIAKKGLAGLK